MTGAELVGHTLVRQSVTTIFSLSGNQIMPIDEACIDTKIRVIPVCHETAAVFMADAWAQKTGRINVALLTASTGVSNSLGPSFSALQAESLVLILSGDSPLSEDGLGAFQELDQVQITAPLTKFSRRVRTVSELAPVIDTAISLALNVRSGPVHLALSFDLLTCKNELHDLPAQYDMAMPAFGGFGASVHEIESLHVALKAAAASGLPSCINVEIDSAPAPLFSDTRISRAAH